MSSTNTPARPGALDAFYTPDAVATACVGVLGLGPGDVAWEPHAGGGAFCRALVAAGVAVYASDIDRRAPALAMDNGKEITTGVEDFLAHPAPARGPANEWIIGNPPYANAEEHLRHALRHETNVAFLLRLEFLEGAKRRDFWRTHPAAEVHVLVNRPSFTGGGTDSAAYGWFVWRRGHVGPAHLHFLDWRAA